MPNWICYSDVWPNNQFLFFCTAPIRQLQLSQLRFLCFIQGVMSVFIRGKINTNGSHYLTLRWLRTISSHVCISGQTQFGFVHKINSQSNPKENMEWNGLFLIPRNDVLNYRKYESQIDIASKQSSPDLNSHRETNRRPWYLLIPPSCMQYLIKSVISIWNRLQFCQLLGDICCWYICNSY